MPKPRTVETTVVDLGMLGDSLIIAGFALAGSGVAVLALRRSDPARPGG